MRHLLLVIGLASLVFQSQAAAGPRRKVLIAPIQGDRGNQLAQAIITALGTRDYAVIGPKVVGREMTKLGLPSELSTDDARALTAKLGAVATVEGSVTSAGKKRRLHLDVHPRNKPSSGFTIEFRTTTSDGFRRGLHDEILKKLDGADLPAGEPVVAPAASPVAAPADPPAAEPAPRPADHPRVADAVTTDGAPGADAGPTVHQQPARATDEPPASIALARVDAGASFAQRLLSFETRAGFAQSPPRVVTTAAAARIDGEIYPFALTGTDTALAGLGLAAAYDRTIGLHLDVPGQAQTAPIQQSHYAVGARYRFVVGGATEIIAGLDYAHREYIVDRSGVMGMLDAPDVDYSAIAPGAQVHVPLTEAIAVFGGVDGMILLDTGAIQSAANYGAGTSYGIEATAGIGVTFARRIALRVAFEFSQIHLAFETGGAMATNRDNDPATRDVNGATDRSIGGVATLGLAY